MGKPESSGRKNAVVHTTEWKLSRQRGSQNKPPGTERLYVMEGTVLSRKKKIIDEDTHMKMKQNLLN